MQLCAALTLTAQSGMERVLFDERAYPASECAAAGCIPSIGKAFGLCR